MSLSDAASLLSIVISVVAIYQARNEALRAEILNQHTMENLAEIKKCLTKIETIVDKQQTKQLGIISDTTAKLLNTVSNAMLQGGNSSGRE